MPKKMYFLKNNEIDSIKCNAYGILFYIFKHFLLEIPRIRGVEYEVSSTGLCVCVLGPQLFGAIWEGC